VLEAVSLLCSLTQERHDDIDLGLVQIGLGCTGQSQWQGGILTSNATLTAALVIHCSLRPEALCLTISHRLEHQE
jgi:hypothetical protein